MNRAVLFALGLVAGVLSFRTILRRYHPEAR